MESWLFAWGELIVVNCEIEWKAAKNTLNRFLLFRVIEFSSCYTDVMKSHWRVCCGYRGFHAVAALEVHLISVCHKWAIYVLGVNHHCLGSDPRVTKLFNRLRLHVPKPYPQTMRIEGWRHQFYCRQPDVMPLSIPIVYVFWILLSVL